MLKIIQARLSCQAQISLEHVYVRGEVPYNGYNMARAQKEEFATYVRNFIFGVEDSLVSTVGLLSGVAVAGLPKEEIFLTGIILIFVEAFSMGVGSYLSEESSEEYQKKKISISIPGALIMFFSYFAAGFIPLSPYILFKTNIALPLSIVFSLAALFVLGIVSAEVAKAKSTFRHGLRMFLIGGMAIAVGVLVGKFVNA
jgi:VIT1/CCC1 family predicted Fe2+/Mn2+ transporter